MKHHYSKLFLSEISLILGILFAFASAAWLGEEQQSLSDGIIRLHVIANSNSDEDQEIKLTIRDQILSLTEQMYPDQATLTEIDAILSQELSSIEQVSETYSNGYPVTAELCEVWFPTKDYEAFSLPAGNYHSLQITIGEGEGENWWCVAYPPLCVGAASQTVDQAVEVGAFSPEQRDMITGDGYVLKFKSIELLENIKHYFN